MRILVVEDERPIQGFLLRGLGEEGHVVDIVEDLASARQRLVDHRPDLLLVDRMLPDGDGLSLVRELRRRGDDIAAICLTARDRVEERVEGLVGGADDYLVKPFSFEELLARIASVTRRSRGPSSLLTVGDLSLDPDTARVTRAGQPIKLTAQEYRLLRYMMENAGRVLSRTRQLESVWDLHIDPGTNVVDVYMSYLRGRIVKDFDHQLVPSVRGLGYVIADRPR